MKIFEHILWLTACAVIVVSGGLYISSQVDTQGEGPSFSGYGNFNIFDNVTHTATTTGADPEPIFLLDRNPERQYARIDNNSATDVYLYFATSTADMVTNQANALNGVVVQPNSSYEILPDNMYTDLVYASSTAASLSINVTEK
jgi:hypothetical protein